MASDGTVAARLLVEVQGRGVTETAAGLGRMDQAVQGSAQSIGGLVRAVGGIYAVKKGFDATIGSAIAWESEFAGVEKTVDGTAGQLADLESELLGMHRTMPVARADLAGIAEAAGALGIKTESIGKFTEVVAQLGETTNVSTEQAATALGQLSNVLGLTEADFDNFGAALVDLGNKGASTEAEILGVTQLAGAGASLIGIAADETLGWGAAVANLGIQAEAGGSALQRFFLGAATHVGEAGEELVAMAQTAGMSAEEFARAFNEDASGALQTFIAGLGEMDQASQLAMLDLLGFGDVRITRTILGLAGNVDNLTDSLEIGAEGWDDNTALVEEYGKRADTAAAKIEVLGNRLGDLGRRIGESAPVGFVIDLIDASLRGWEQSFDDWGDFTNAIAMNWGDMQTRLREEAAKTGTGIGQFQEMVKDNMEEFGISFEDAIFLAQRSLADFEGALVSSSSAAHEWSDEQKAAYANIPTTATEATEGFAQNFEISEATEEELAEAREAAIDGMANILDALNNSLRDGKAGYEQSWEDYLEGQKDPFTTAQRASFIAGMFTGDEFDRGLHSKDPEHVANTVEYVNAQLAELNLLIPGALETGEGVPEALKTGMESIMPELQQYIIDKTGETLDNLSLEEAETLGIDGIYLYWQGIKSEEYNAFLAAQDVRQEVEGALNFSAYAGGASIIRSWVDGMWGAWGGSEVYRVAGLAGTAARYFGRSLPTEGPLAGGVGSGGDSIIQSWIDGMAGRFASDLPRIEGIASGVDAALRAAIGTPAMDASFPAIAGGGGASSGSGMYVAGDYHKTVEVYVEGRPLDGSVDELVRAVQDADAVSNWNDIDG